MCTIHRQSKCRIVGPCCEYGCGTIRPIAQFNPENDCRILRDSMNRSSKNEQGIIDILSRRSLDQRLHLRHLYRQMFTKDLIADVKGALSGDMERTAVILLEEPAVVDANYLRESVKGLGTNEDLLTEILVTRSFRQIQEIKNAYAREFKRDLVKDVESDTSGGYKTMLLHCLRGDRPELTTHQIQHVAVNGPDSVVDYPLAKRQAEELKTGHQKRSSTDENPFIRIICMNHLYQLRAVFEEYYRITNRDIYTGINRELSGDLMKGLHAMAMAQANRTRYFAERLNQAMKGLGTDESTLIRICVTRSEIDLLDIKEDFQQMYKKPLDATVASETSGNFKNILLSIIQGNN